MHPCWKKSINLLKNLTDPKPLDVSVLCNLLMSCLLSKCLHAVETQVIIKFLPTVLVQLFGVLTMANKEGQDIAVNSTR